jgi:hypothetical protein
MVVAKRRRTKALGWLSLALFVLAAVAIVVPVTLFALATSDKGVALHGGATAINAPPHRTWGVYVNDVDNSGYSESCTATDSSGRAIAIRDAGPRVTSSDTEMLDLVLTTPRHGSFTISCSVGGAEARVAPVGNFPLVLMGLLAAALLGLGGLIVGILWLVRLTSGPAPGGVAPGAEPYAN